MLLLAVAIVIVIIGFFVWKKRRDVTPEIVEMGMKDVSSGSQPANDDQE